MTVRWFNVHVGNYFYIKKHDIFFIGVIGKSNTGILLTMRPYRENMTYVSEPY